MEPNKEYRTFQINIKNGHKMYTYFDELCLNSNNLYNTTNFFIRQVYTAFKNEGVLQPLQQEVMNTILDNIDGMNVNQQKAYSKKLEKENKKLNCFTGRELPFQEVSEIRFRKTQTNQRLYP